MDYTQRHQAAMDAIRKDFDENEDEVLKVPNYSLMERFFVFGGKDPWLLYAEDYLSCQQEEIKKCYQRSEK